MMCCILLPVDRALLFCVEFFHVWNLLRYFLLYFSACRTRYGIFCCIFLRMERALVVLLYISACETCSGILCCIFLHVERALVFCVVFFYVWSVLWYFVLYIFVCRTCSGLLCNIFSYLSLHFLFYYNYLSFT